MIDKKVWAFKSAIEADNLNQIIDLVEKMKRGMENFSIPEVDNAEMRLELRFYEKRNSEDVIIKEVADAIYRGYWSDSHYLFGIPPEHEKAVRSIIKLAITKYKECQNE